VLTFSVSLPTELLPFHTRHLCSPQVTSKTSRKELHKVLGKKIQTQTSNLKFAPVQLREMQGPGDLISAACIGLYRVKHCCLVTPGPHHTHPRRWRRVTQEGEGDPSIIGINIRRASSSLKPHQPYPDIPAVTISTTHPIKVSSLIFTSPNISLTAANAILPFNSPSLSLSSVCASLACCCCC